MIFKPYEKFGITKLVPLQIVFDGRPAIGFDYEETLWVERAEDWYALISPQLRGKRVRIVSQKMWLIAEEETKMSASDDFDGYDGDEDNDLTLDALREEFNEYKKKTEEKISNLNDAIDLICQELKKFRSVK